MNKQRRKELNAMIGPIEELFAKIESLKEDLQPILDAEDEAYNNLPESMQESEKGQLMEAAKGAMEEALNYLDEAATALESAKEQIEEAKGENQ